MKYFSRRDILWIIPLSLGFGAILSYLQSGNRLIGWLGFSFLFLLSFFLLSLSTRWGNDAGLDTGRNAPVRPPKTLAWMVFLAFALRFVGGVATYLILPINGHNDQDDKAGFIYTDAHRRDSQAWELADSERPLTDAFNEKFAYDQYGGLLAFSALTYRYLSPDAHRPLMLVLLSAFAAALGIPFLWRAASQLWGEKIALASCWIFALYPESILLGGSAMREPYLMMFSAFSLWGFADWLKTHAKSSLIWLGLGIAGMLLVSPGVAVATLVLLAGCIYFRSERGRLPWWIIAAIAVVFVGSLFVLSSALNRGGSLGGGTPVGVINAFLREAIKWDVYQLERGSGWVQKLFDEMPEWLRLPFVTVYGIFQPVLPAAFVEPTTLIWRIIGILRAAGWYALLPLLILSFAAAAGSRSRETRNLWMWITFFAWTWILLAALRGGGDQWDNPRYRAILFLWEAAAAGQAFVWWRESKNRWFGRVILMEVVFLLFFTQWYARRYYHIGVQLPFGQMVMIIIGLWILIALGGWIWDRLSRA